MLKNSSICLLSMFLQLLIAFVNTFQLGTGRSGFGIWYKALRFPAKIHILSYRKNEWYRQILILTWDIVRALPELAEFSCLIISIRLVDLFLRVHDERPLRDDRLVERNSVAQQDL